ncbi:hypothetical protein AK812_SmicGene7180 [Symbiodinium microadriaticum]|uniref:Uncharacterized protein n=1 Tax=Symbiodinium microadriaticum TaxID=2951 RepID=A0A1Q9EPC7_SYMMI|nr:hypothetical protein AK812_SmicGene7180 [Symbiodinium microadriaticum]
MSFMSIDANTNLPWLKVSDWLAYLLRRSPELVCGGYKDVSQAQHMRQEFWQKFREFQADHEVFKLPDLKNVIPICLHGDKGRGYGKTPMFCFSFECVFGLPRNIRSAASRAGDNRFADNGGHLDWSCGKRAREDHGMQHFNDESCPKRRKLEGALQEMPHNGKGHVFLSHFLVGAISNKLMKEHPQAVDIFLKEMAQDLGAIAREGLTVKGETYHIGLLGVKGDCEFHVECGADAVVVFSWLVWLLPFKLRAPKEPEHIELLTAMFDCLRRVNGKTAASKVFLIIYIIVKYDDGGNRNGVPLAQLRPLEQAERDGTGLSYTSTFNEFDFTTGQLPTGVEDEADEDMGLVRALQYLAMRKGTFLRLPFKGMRHERLRPGEPIPSYTLTLEMQRLGLKIRNTGKKANALGQRTVLWVKLGSKGSSRVPCGTKLDEQHPQLEHPWSVYQASFPEVHETDELSFAAKARLEFPQWSVGTDIDGKLPVTLEPDPKSKALAELHPGTVVQCLGMLPLISSDAFNKFFVAVSLGVGGPRQSSGTGNGTRNMDLLTRDVLIPPTYSVCRILVNMSCTG